MLSILRVLGLNIELDRTAIIVSATSIAKDANNLLLSDDKKTDEKENKTQQEIETELNCLTKRSKSLLKYLDNHWDELFTKQYEWNILSQYEWLPIINDCTSTLCEISRYTHPLLPYRQV